MTVLPPQVSGGVPVLGHALEFVRNPETLLRRGYDEHGLIFSMRFANKDSIVLLGAEHSMFVFTETDRRLSLRDAYPFLRRQYDSDFYFFAEYEDYRRQRGVLMPRFQGKQLGTYVEAMYGEIRELEKQLGDSGEFELNSTFGPMVMRIAARALLGEKFSSKLRMDDFLLFREFAASVRHTVTPSWLPTPRNLRSNRARRTLVRMLGAELRDRRENPVDPPDFLQMLCEATFADGEPVPDHIAVNMLLLLVWAGHETTTGHLGWALIDLLRNPAEFAAVRAEQDAILGTGEVPTLRHVREMKHLDHALHETERMRPVVPVMLRIASEDIEYAGYRIPKGAHVIISPSVSHQIPESFVDPLAYRPDRFAEARAKSGLIGFGGGIHRCIGTHFAYLEMTVTLGHLVRAFDFELVDPDPRPMPGALTKWPLPCVVRYRRRDG